MNTIRIVIEVRGGSVQAVYADSPLTAVVVDYDNDGAEFDGRAASVGVVGVDQDPDTVAEAHAAAAGVY